MTKQNPQTPQPLTHNNASMPQQGGHGTMPSAPPSTHDNHYEIGYQLALDELGYSGMQAKVFADAFIGEYRRALSNGLTDVLAIRFAAEFAGSYAHAFIHFLSSNGHREEEADVYGEARIFAEMSFDNFEEKFAADFAHVISKKTEEKRLREAISNALNQDVSLSNLAEALQNDRAKIYKSAHEAGHRAGMEEGHRAGLEEGKAEGHNTGLEEGRKQGFENGFVEGEKEGHKFGLQEGISQGYEEAMKEH